jgi:hypothetical protein
MTVPGTRSTSLRRLAGVAAIVVTGAVAIGWLFLDEIRPESAPAAIAATCADDVGEAMVKFRDSVSSDAIAAIHKQVGAEVIRSLQDNIQWVRAHGYCDESLIRAYRDRKEVEWVQPAPNRMK